MTAPARPRVLMLLENGPYSRDARVPNEAETLVSAGYQVTVICPGEQDLPRRDQQSGVRIYRFRPPPEGEGLLGYALEYGYAMVAVFLLSLLVWWREGFDVVHAHCPPDTFVFIGVFYKFLGKRFVYDHHDLSPELYSARCKGGHNSFVYRILILLERFCCRLADHVIATNHSYKAVEMERGGVPETRITVVRNGPDLNRLKPGGPHPERREDDQTWLGYVGWMGFQDGVDYLLRALHHLAHDLGRSDFHCILAGSGDAMPTLDSLTEELGLGNHVSFAGWVAPHLVAHFLDRADICVAPEPSSPYNDRSTAIKIMEYMALGRPIVCFDLPENRVTAGNAAAYARPNDELDFARQVSALMDDLERRERMGKEGRERVENELAWPHQARLLLAAYGTLFPEWASGGCRDPLTIDGG
jgi:glycosyltransferase involved in cell wall biosynthesis